MDSDIFQKVTGFQSPLFADKNHRYKSWEHCYSHFTRDEARRDVDTSCLHLSFYLASWGMYRGSSFLLWKDYKIHADIVKELLRNKELQRLDFSSIDDAGLQRIIDLSQWIKESYRNNIKRVNGKLKTVNATDTLVTKIMLGTLGCIPAYDRYCVNGMRKSDIRYSKLSKSNLNAVVEYYKENQTEFARAQKAIFENGAIHYPAMKLVDMYFWEIGFEADMS